MQPRQEFQEKVAGYLERIDAGADIEYSVGPEGVEFSAEVSDDTTGLTAELAYQADSDSTWSGGASGELGLEVYGDETLYDRTVEAVLEGSHMDEDILVKPASGRMPKPSKELHETVEEAITFAQDMVSSPSILRYEQMFENSTSIRNDAATQLRKNTRNQINRDTEYPSSPIREFGKGLVYTRHPQMDAEEAREQLENSEESEKWRELGEKIRDDEIDHQTYQEIVDTLERNPEKKVTDLAV